MYTTFYNRGPMHSHETGWDRVVEVGVVHPHSLCLEIIQTRPPSQGCRTLPQFILNKCLKHNTTISFNKINYFPLILVLNM